MYVIVVMAFEAAVFGRWLLTSSEQHGVQSCLIACLQALF